jgi:hypothetical protein
MQCGRWLARGVAAVVVMATARDAAAEEPLPWSRGTLAPRAEIGVGPGSDVTSLRFGVGLDWFAGRGFSLGVTVHDELLVYSSSIRGRLPDIEDQLPTNIIYVVPTARWVFFRRFRFSPYVFAGIGPAFLNNDHGIIGHWQAGPSAYIGLVGGLFLDVGVVFSGGFPGRQCNASFLYRPPESTSGAVQLSECEFSWSPKIGLAYAFGFAEKKKQRRPPERPATDVPVDEPAPADPAAHGPGQDPPPPDDPPVHGPPPPIAEPGPGPAPGS